jgi:DNA-binding LacI/PurR family transcriptional regulator
MAKIILSVPHAHCRSESDKILHFCDVVAGDAARELQKRLTDAGHEVMLHIGDINREEMDLNRSVSRNTEFRKKLEADFSKADFLLDVHSTFRSRITWEEDLVILKWKTNEADNRKYTYDLLKKLVDQDLSAAIVYARAEDDIVDQATHAGLPAVLVEFSELTFADDANWLMEQFVKGFNQFIESLPELGKPETPKSELDESLSKLFAKLLV